MEIEIMEPEENPHVNDAFMVIFSMNRFQKGSPERNRLCGIWLRASLSGAIREQFPAGTEDLKREWDAVVSECRRMFQ